MLPVQTLFALLLLVLTSTAFVLQDLPLERFERSGHSEEADQFERQARAGLIFRPAANFMTRYRMLSG
ncbi:unnamed protein product [Caenorhabditis sp. 36 PRJEB53466]|nr:unnamed protein product [Caenorhabditis sp. 36 PRJEB53466]